MADQPIIIQPTRPPLSHLADTRRVKRDWFRLVWMGAISVVLICALLWVFSIEAPRVELNNSAISQSAAPDQVMTKPAHTPFADLEYERQLTAAKAKLESLVETQIALKESMQVGEWGTDAYQAALTKATDGDVAFQEKRYEAAYLAYDEAAAAFIALKERGEALFEEHVKAGVSALDQRNPVTATREFEAALIIRKDDPAALAGLARARKLPKVIELLRQATNHELAENWQAALAAYDQIAQLDPQTVGLAALRANVGSLTTEQQIKSQLTQGFAAMKLQQFDRARSAFNRVLVLDPGNAVASGALAQVSNQGDINRIKSGEQTALAAEAREDWAGAKKAYEAVLAIDGAIEFARTGVVRVDAHARATRVLAKVRAEPDKLSSAKLFAEAKNVLQEAQALQPGGPTLKGHIEAVGQLLERYSNPIDVTIRSDGKTDIVLSSVGNLGSFAARTVNLRPGEYTIIGSQNGCRDVRKTIVVKPDMEDVSVACNEAVAP
jgi:tetratricopeptide (TPR) repeat protein